MVFILNKCFLNAKGLDHKGQKIVYIDNSRSPAVNTIVIIVW